MTVSEVEGHFEGDVSFNFVLFHLQLIVVDDFLDFLLVLEQVGLHFLEPLLLAVVFEFEDGFGDDALDDAGLYFLEVDIPVHLNVDEEGSEDQIFLEVELVFHLLNLCENLISQQSQPGQVLLGLSSLNLEGQKVILLEYQNWMSLRRNHLH